MRARLLHLVVAFLAAGATPAIAFQRFDFDQRYFIQPGFIVKDHTTVRATDGTTHLFYIKADETLPESQRAKALGHATTTDLIHWTFHPDVIPVVPDTWEESFVWAPHIVEWYGYYFMYYTGVNRFYAQAIGMASSRDLYEWTKYQGNPVYTPSTSWASWNSGSWSNCRDPYVFQDQGLWYMTTTAWTNTSKGALSFASSPDLVNWTDLGPLLVHPGPQAWHVLESSNVHFHDGKYHLFMTEQNIGGSTYMSAPALTGPWNYASRQPFDAGHATEVFQWNGEWMLSRHTTFTFDGLPRYTIKYDKLDWDTVGKPIVQFVDPMAGWTMWSGDAFYLQPTFWNNTWARGAGDANLGGNSWIGTYELFTGPLQVGFPGLTAGDAPKGIIRSSTFTLTGNRLSFRIGGGNDPQKLYLALYTAAGPTLHLRATGDGTETMRDVEWDVSPWTGSQVFLEIADLSSGAMGHVNVDEIVESWSQPTDVATPPAGHALLHANTPNPFNPMTRIAFETPRATHARLRVYDLRGRIVRTLVDARVEAGSHAAWWDGLYADGSRAASGLYFYRLEVEGESAQARTMVLLK
jgi:predicted GH43/DUF377 family glycosyl hydrolase